MDNKQIPFFRMASSKEEIAAVVNVIESGWLTTGNETKKFEKRFAEYIGAKHALAVNSATSALHLALDAVGIVENDKVIVPVHTFTATAEVARYLGAEIVFADIDKDTFCISCEDVHNKLRAAEEEHLIKAIMPVHFGGHSCDMDSIMAMAEQFNVKVIEDAAHSLPTTYRWNHQQQKASKIGTIGDATCFSFYANKTITTGEGGMLVTNDDEIAKRVSVMRLHGIDRDVWERFTSKKPSWYYEVVQPGYKYNLTDVAAAMGLVQLSKCDQFQIRRAEIAQLYRTTLADIDGIRLPKINCEHDDHSWHLFVILINSSNGKARIDRNTFIHKMAEKNIGTSVHYIPLHLQPYYKKRYGLKANDFPNSTWVYERCVSLPIYPDMKDDEVEYVVDTIKEIMGT